MTEPPGRSRDRRRPEPGEQARAPVVPIEALTREATLRRLASLARGVDPAPTCVSSEALAAYEWRSVDDELAALVYDSDRDEDALAGIRSGGGSRHLTFEAPALLLEVEVTLGRRREIVCQVVPSQPARLEVRHERGTLPPESDSHGTFHVTSVPPGPVSIRCQPLAEGADAVATSWIRI